MPAIDFIKLLIQHIPEWNFKMTRYYGLYARHRAGGPSLGSRAIHPSRHAILRSFGRWREMTILSFGYDPLQCPGCRNNMTL
ncbi:MAG: hypothetical protein HFH97_14940 [Lachnospiraceae bacterium]|nr:hypothetical protein [Lachnospiraceae bacterium]MCI9573878.1 hypothetical protein [Lachnospiraceae bacterium]